MVTTVESKYMIRTLYTGSLKMEGRHTASDLENFFERVVLELAGNRLRIHYDSDSVPVNKAAVRKFLGIDGDFYWFLCSAQFCQSAMCEAVTPFLSTADAYVNNMYDMETLTNDELLYRTHECEPKNSYKRNTTTYRAIRMSIKKSHSYAQLFHECELAFNVTCTNSADVHTRFDSTVAISTSAMPIAQLYVWKNEEEEKIRYGLLRFVFR